jgi:hypothetical protein
MRCDPLAAFSVTTAVRPRLVLRTATRSDVLRNILLGLAARFDAALAIPTQCSGQCIRERGDLTAAKRNSSGEIDRKKLVNKQPHDMKGTPSSEDFNRLGETMHKSLASRYTPEQALLSAECAA